MFQMFAWENGRVGVARRSQVGDLRSGEILAATAAVELLQAFRHSATAMAVLRRVLGEDVNPQRVTRMSDDDVVTQIRQGIAMDRFLVVRERADWRTATTGVSIVESPPPPAPAAASPRTAGQPPPATPRKTVCSNPACAAAFTDAAASGTATVERGGAGC